MGELYSFNREVYPFEMFTFEHIMMLIITVVLIMGLYFFREEIRNQFRRSVKFILITLLILSEAIFHVWFIIHDRWDITINLPLQLCSISLYLCVWMLITKSNNVFEVAFFISMTGAAIAIITPELFFGFPHLRFFQFFIAHIVIVLSCFYMLWVERLALTFRSVIKAFLILNAIAFVVYWVNQWLGSNYMFLANQPSNASIIDFLGPYPWYIVSLEAIAVALFLIIFFIYKKSHHTHNISSLK
ncbi:YwaF family protein [Piscibacillus sp. B03]|uniref:YwaF family protein n=1 Tax=Piscibacillus sp. B03 TaxID=3457430 RepID=UPI003FCC6BE6